MSQTSIELLKACYLISFSLGLWTCVSLSVTQKNERQTRVLLIIYVALLLVPPVNAYLNLISQGAHIWLMILNQNLVWLYGPILYFLVKKILLKQPELITIGIHLIPFAITLSVRLSEIHIEFFNANYFTLLYSQIFCYTIFSTILITRRRNKFKNLIFFHQDSTYFWLVFLILGAYGLTLFDIIIINLFNFGYFPDLKIISIIACGFSVYVSSLALLVIYQPKLISETISQENTQNEDDKESKIQLRNIELTTDLVADIDRRLEKFVVEYQPHLDESISLGKLASFLGITRNQLSEFFNVHKNTSFYEFLNKLRYEESITLLTKTNSDLTIADIAYQAGFNNRNSFYKVFKEKTGITPAEFRKEIRKS